MTWDPDDKLRTALHYAGQAIVARSFDKVPERVRLNVSFEDGKMDGLHKGWLSDLSVIAQIAIALAGYEAEQAFHPPGRKEKAKYDLREVRRLLQANGTPEPDPAGQAIKEQGRALARDRLVQHSAKLHRLAQRLLEDHEFDRHAFEALMAE